MNLNSKSELSNEKDIIEQARTNPQAFGKIYDAFFDQIFRYIVHRTANVSDAEDITAQTFYKALKSLPRFNWKGISISSWLYRIATNETNSYLRKKMKNSSVEDDTFYSSLEDSRHDQEQELEQAENDLFRHQLFLQLHVCIRELKPFDQSLLVLRFFENKNYPEISQILKKKTGALMMRTKRALEKLQIHLKKRGFDYEKIRDCTDQCGETEFTSRCIQKGFAPPIT